MKCRETASIKRVNSGFPEGKTGTEKGFSAVCRIGEFGPSRDRFHFGVNGIKNRKEIRL